MAIGAVARRKIIAALGQASGEELINYIENADETLETDTISESTAGAGVTIDGVLLKDSTVEATLGYRGAGSTLAPLVPAAAQQALTGSGAINVTTYYTAWNTTGGGAGTLADGVQIGQLKKVQLIVDGGDGTLTPVNLANGTTITFADVGDFALMIWNGTDWVAIALGNDADGVTAPVLA